MRVPFDPQAGEGSEPFYERQMLYTIMAEVEQHSDEVEALR